MMIISTINFGLGGRGDGLNVGIVNVGRHGGKTTSQQSTDFACVYKVVLSGVMVGETSNAPPRTPDSLCERRM